MAEFTPQQRAVLTSTARSNLVNAISKTGKTTLLTRLYLNRQEQPGEFKAVFVTSNGLSTERVVEQLQKITSHNWVDQLVGTLAEIAYKLLQRHYADLTYRRIPRVLPETAMSQERMTAKITAAKIHPDQTSSAFLDIWNQEFVHRLRQQDIATPRSLVIEAANLFSKLSHPSLSNVRLLLADNVHDFTMDELMSLAAIQERMEQTFIAGNTNIAINDRFQDTDVDNWISLAAGFKTFSLTSSFNIGPNQGLFLHQLAAFNSKKLYETGPVFTGDANAQTLYEVLVPSTEYMVGVIHELENHFQLGIRNRLLGVVMRSMDEVKAMARSLGRPYFIQWDKHRLANRFEPPNKGIVVTTPYDAPFLNLDYVVMPNCMNTYWPYLRERSTENCRRQFIRSVSSAKLGVIFLIPDPSNGLLVSPFVSEGCNPKLVTKVAQFSPTTRA